MQAQLTLAADFASERGHVKGGFDLARDEVGQTGDETVRERRENREIVCRLER